MSASLLCPACADPIHEAHRFCPRCGTNLDVSETPTGTAPRPATPGPRRGSDPGRPKSGGSSHRTPGSSAAGISSEGAGQFLPGTLLVDRYRVVGLLGKGGMGEVHRADDLTLEQPVALKFLPPGFESNRERLERFYDEVRIARQVAHPAVCRVYDIGEVDGQHFLSMEYVDGENLASLQRRIGRLPADKALDIAHQLCAGVAAAHDKGVLHRDLKPENVMLDGEGKVRITDFGLAGLEDTIRGDDVRSGTPAYMSPEQLTGREVTARSDVYSLGLVLYELFTGKKAFVGKTFAELLRKHRDERPIEPALIVPDIAPAVDRTIQRCIEKEPSRRPPSARAVSVLLSGGDPLAAAIAAGETPSPDLVAAAGESEGLRPAFAVACLATVLAVLAISPLAFRTRSLLDRMPPTKPPAALEDRARDLIHRLGHSAPEADAETGFGFDMDYLNQVSENDPSPRRWDGLATGHPPAVFFYYRQSPRPLVSTAVPGVVTWGNPALELSGMAGARLDLQGHLLSYYSIPPQVDPPAAESGPPDWAPLFAEAHLDPTRLRPTASTWTPPFFCDTRAAWEGAFAERPDIPIRVEAAAYRGRPVSFFIVAPWTRPARMEPRLITPLQRASIAVSSVLVLFLAGSGAVLAHRNVRLGRGDRRGAFRLALSIFTLAILAWACAAHHVAEVIGEMSLLGRGAAASLLLATIVWLFYLALEPYVRRLRPQTLVSWTRLLAGGARDAIVGQEVLIGAVWGALLAMGAIVCFTIPQWLGQPPPMPWPAAYETALGARGLLALAFLLLIHSIEIALAALLLFLLVRLLLGHDRRAVWVYVLVLTAIQAVELADDLSQARWFAVPISLLIMGSYAWLLLRFGLVSAISGMYVLHVLQAFPLSTELGSWRGGPTVFVMVLLTAVAVFAFRTSLGAGRSVRRPPLPSFPT
jgi:serine/threonine-protein kinase